MGLKVTDVGYHHKNDKPELKKHAATIHCSNSLSLLQRKISNALLYHAYKELMLKDEHEISVKQLCRLIGYNGNNHSAIKDALKGLISTVIEWNLIDNETGAENWTASSIIASVSLEGPLCYYAYSPRMKQLLHSPSMFGKVDLVIQARFRSTYGLALYENCIRYRGLPNTKWVTMDLFKKLMGIQSGTYDIFRDFKRRVIDKAIDEVNTYSDLVIAADFLREGRKVKKIRFKLKERAKKARLGFTIRVDKESEDKEFRKRLATFSLSKEQIETLLFEYDKEFIEAKMAIIEASKPYQEGKIHNLAAYLLSAVKHDYQASRSKPDENPRELLISLEMSDIKRQVEQLRFQYNTYRERAIHTVIEELATDIKEVFMSEFFIFAEPIIKSVLQLQYTKYNRGNILESPQIQALLRQYALRKLDLTSLCTLEEFVAQQSEAQIEGWQKLKVHDPDHPLLCYTE